MGGNPTHPDPSAGTDTTATATPARGSADGSPLPDGIVAAHGTSKMRTRQSDFTRENIAAETVPRPRGPMSSGRMTSRAERG